MSKADIAQVVKEFGNQVSSRSAHQHEVTQLSTKFDLLTQQQQKDNKLSDEQKRIFRVSNQLLKELKVYTVSLNLTKLTRIQNKMQVAGREEYLNALFALRFVDVYLPRFLKYYMHMLDEHPVTWVSATCT